MLPNYFQNSPFMSLLYIQLNANIRSYHLIYISWFSHASTLDILNIQENETHLSKLPEILPNTRNYYPV